LQREAKMTMSDARAMALRTVSTATLQAGEIEREGGKLIYGFDMKVPGRSGIDEVNIDAMTSKLVSHQHDAEGRACRGEGGCQGSEVGQGQALILVDHQRERSPQRPAAGFSSRSSPVRVRARAPRLSVAGSVRAAHHRIVAPVLTRSVW